MNDKLPCFECQDGHYEKVRQTFVSQCNDGSFLTVPDIDILTCVKCGDECLDSENSKKIDKARDEYRKNNMKEIKPSINVKYIVEVKDLHSGWQEIGCSTRLEDAIKDIENERKLLPKQEFRLIRSEWTVIG